MNGLTFTAIDFETANTERVSACSVGLCVVDNGIITNTKSFLVRPPEEACWFDDINVSIHGITFGNVKNCGFFCDIWPSIEPMLKDRVLAAHNMPFDKSVLTRLMERYAISPVHAGTICTLRLSKRILPGFDNYKLDTVCRKTGVKMNGKHHDAGADAAACANILLCMAEKKKFWDIGEVMAFLNLKQPAVKSPKPVIKPAASTLWRPGMGSVSVAAPRPVQVCTAAENEQLPESVFGNTDDMYIFDSELDVLAERPGDGNDGLPTAKQLSYMKYLRKQYSSSITKADISSKQNATIWISEIVSKNKGGHCR